MTTEGDGRKRERKDQKRRALIPPTPTTPLACGNRHERGSARGHGLHVHHMDHSV